MGILDCLVYMLEVRMGEQRVDVKDFLDLIYLVYHLRPEVEKKLAVQSVFLVIHWMIGFAQDWYQVFEVMDQNRVQMGQSVVVLVGRGHFSLLLAEQKRAVL